MKGLMLHTGAQHVDYDRVAASHTPEATDSHQPIPHSHLVDLVRDQIETSKLRIVDESHGLTKDDNRYFGLMRLAGTDADRQDYGAVLGIRNSHDKRFPAALAIGSSVFVCDNLAFSGEVKLARRHTKHILGDLGNVVARTFGKLTEAWVNQNTRFDAYKEQGLSRLEAHDLIIQGFQRGACTSTQIRRVLEQYHTPNHPEFQERNAWSLFNAFTEVLKGNLNELPKRTQSLHAVFDGHCGVLLENEAADLVNN